jgi:hypothetical protein
MIESLPDRPLLDSELEALRESDRFASIHEFVAHGGPDRERILQFLIESDGQYTALHFDLDRDTWQVVGRAGSFEAASQALSEARS